MRSQILNQLLSKSSSRSSEVWVEYQAYGQKDIHKKMFWYVYTIFEGT